ncbi:hypothetical protein EYW49_15345 [Siculibacillus lacustris]|uniref:Uncharacterized protein n=1 Tax=Siculibacillus lacustris TaxID=1549641 RepID=A0A4Q9VLU8_9HYPH|nr:hypothetical protein [Siculibacillus lacustris]TBW35985.1 hypothetical protein EYW49_15345 [Siculibacillus lacustris]
MPSRIALPSPTPDIALPATASGRPQVEPQQQVIPDASGADHAGHRSAATTHPQPPPALRVRFSARQPARAAPIVASGEPYGSPARAPAA